jgi:hypothetical protein
MIRALPIISLLCVAQLSAGCNIGVSAKRAPSPGGAVINRCRNVRVPADGVFDDFEDGDRQASKIGKRGGYWWTKKDEVGSTIEFNPDEPGASGSELAMHVTGTTATGSAETAWGAGLGVNFSTQNGELYDASRYAGIVFKAKAEPGTARTVRFNIADVFTHKDGGICRTCWNHFGAYITLTTEWKEYKVMFAAAAQRPDWGDPRPISISPNKLYGLDWSVEGGGPYDFWLDDIALVECE